MRNLKLFFSLPVLLFLLLPGCGFGQSLGGHYLGFDRNDYPGDAALRTLRQHFSFVGYWITDPPGENQNTWVGKRSTLLAQGFGFLVLANGRLDAEILR
ncbi:MAG TPA: hypothetical protein VH250_02670, partial [Granulicella sp.]|nr:hypothetical protein [Granulicella sp.]